MIDRELMQEVLDFLVGGDFAYPTKLATDLRERLAHCDRCGKKLGGEGDIHTCTPLIGCVQHDCAECKARLAQPEQEPVACQYAKDVAMPEYRCAGKCQYAQPEQEQWDAIPDAFNEWWNADYDDTGNPYRKDSPAYWAWSGWKAASKQPEQEPVAWGCNRYIEDDNGFQIGTDEPELAWGKLAPDDNGWWPLYTAPPQRKPLTDEEIDKIYETKVWDARRSFARAIEAAHGIGEKPDAA